jgi:hypothetical protein
VKSVYSKKNSHEIVLFSIYEISPLPLHRDYVESL